MRGKCIKNLRKKAGKGNKQPSQKCEGNALRTFAKMWGKETNNPRKNAREQWLVN